MSGPSPFQAIRGGTESFRRRSNVSPSSRRTPVTSSRRVIGASVRLLPWRRLAGDGRPEQAELGKPISGMRGCRPEVASLVYELLDAHDDTAAIARELANVDDRWQQHLAYLQSLQRTGREALAQLYAEEVR